MMSSPNYSTSDIEDAFFSILFLTILRSHRIISQLHRSSSFNSSENSKDNMIPPVFSPFYNNPCLKDVAFYAKESPIPPPDPITPPVILTPSLELPPSLLFDPRYFFVPEELLPPKKQIHSPSSSSTTLSNSSRNQTCDLVSPSFSVYTPTPPQIFKIGKSSKEDNKLKTELEKVRSQIIKLQRKQLGQRDKIAFAHKQNFQIFEQKHLKRNQARHQRRNKIRRIFRMTSTGSKSTN
ncbi:hypothetical protein Tco_1108290 [Tanacetum coccineum]